MLNNFINIRDFLYLFDKGAKNFNIRFSANKEERVKAAWSKVVSPPVNWWDVPRIRVRWNTMITGDANLPINDYFAQKYLSDKKPLTGLSLGCGSGANELLWAKTGMFSRIDAYDLSPERINKAKQNAENSEYGHLVRFKVGDVMKIESPACSYDMIIVEGAMHHFSPLREILNKINFFLRPGGYLYIRDFVGPTRFQWTDRQLQAINAMLDLLPNSYKKIWGEEKFKRNMYKHCRLGMILLDPSEAVESSSILPLVRDMFETIELKIFGGTLLHPMLSGIAHNFLSDDPETQKWLDICFEVEDALMECGEISSDYVVALCQKSLRIGT